MMFILHPLSPGPPGPWWKTPSFESKGPGTKLNIFNLSIWGSFEGPSMIVIFLTFIKKTDHHDFQQPSPLIITNFPRTLLKSKTEKPSPSNPPPSGVDPKAKAKAKAKSKSGSKPKRKNAERDEEGQPDDADATEPDAGQRRKRRSKPQSWGRFEKKHMKCFNNSHYLGPGMFWFSYAGCILWLGPFRMFEAQT